MRFAGENDGEYALYGCEDLTANNCYFNLRHLVHNAKDVKIIKCTFGEGSDESLWYSNGISITNSKLAGIKAVRECSNVFIKDSLIKSFEFGQKCDAFEANNLTVHGDCVFKETKNLKAKDLSMKGEFAFQYVENSLLDHCSFDTKEAFWHAKNVLIRNSYIRGECLGWYSENLTLINCIIEGSKPLCFAKNLKLIDCKMVNTDFAFDGSVVDASLIGHVDSIKNPLKGSRILLDSVGKIIKDTDEEFGEIRRRK